MAKSNRKNKKVKHKKMVVNDVPGALNYIGEKESLTTSVEIINYDKVHYTRQDSNSVEDAFHFKGVDRVTWINVNGLNNTSQIEVLGEHYNLHPLVLEDIVSTNQRPKIDEYEGYMFLVFKMLYYNADNEFITEHISLVLGEGYVLTFQEANGDVFDSLRERIANAKGRIRNAGADYLMFAIADAIVDNYFSIIETLGDKIEALEDTLFTQNATDEITIEIQEFKREILKIRRSVFPLREVINRLEKSDNPLIDERTQNYLRDLYDHIIQVSENIDIYREMIWGLMDMYMTTISNKMNEVMKVLTIMASIFIPLTFMAGIYGMNFEYIPELKFQYGYFYLWGAMLFVFFGMLYYFKRKKWL